MIDHDAMMGKGCDVKEKEMIWNDWKRKILCLCWLLVLFYVKMGKEKKRSGVEREVCCGVKMKEKKKLRKGLAGLEPFS